MKRYLSLFLCLCLPSLAIGQEPQPLYDASLSPEGREPDPATRAVAEQWVREVLAARDVAPDDCMNGIYLPDVATGSFTAAGAWEQVVVWSCAISRAMVHGGLLLLADGRIVAAVDEVYAGALGALPDINDNGRQEILLRNWFTGQGVTEDAFSIIELGTGEARNLGRFAGGVDACGTGRDDMGAEAYRYRVRPGSEPVYFRQRLVKDDCESDEWVADGEFVPVSPEIDPPSYPLLGS